MKNIRIIDTTLKRADDTLSFKEKLECARLLEKLSVDAIELPPIRSGQADALLVRTLSSFVKKAQIALAVDANAESLSLALAALERVANGVIAVELPVSSVGMEYSVHKKGAAFLDFVKKTVAEAAAAHPVTFTAKDAARAEGDFLLAVLNTAKEAGAAALFLSDDTGESLPAAFGKLAGDVSSALGMPVGISVSNKNGLALADCLTALVGEANAVKVAVDGDVTDLYALLSALQKSGELYGLNSGVSYTELTRLSDQIGAILHRTAHEKISESKTYAQDILLSADADCAAVALAVKKLGYDLGAEDEGRVYEEVTRTAAKKKIGARELDAIVANTALQVPPTYKLESYVVNSGNIISSSAQITLNREGKTLHGISMGDGPIDAAFLALEQIIGHHYELDDFEIQAVTEGREAMGSALVKLRADGKVYSGSGLSTDIIGASIRAYVSALNKIIYEETVG